MAAYHEIIIKGEDREVRAFLSGFFAGRGVTSGFYFGRDWPFHLRHLREKIKFHGDVVHVICLGELTSVVEAALRKTHLCMEVKETFKIASVSFRFDFQTANREVGTSIKRALARMPEGVVLEDYEPSEVVDPTATGVERYAPLHPYEFKGTGVVKGAVEGVLHVHKRLSENTAFHVEEIDIQH